MDTGAGFKNISDNNNYSGTSTDLLQLESVPSAWYGNKYRCIAGESNSNIYAIAFVNNWTGSVNTAWEDARNWSCGIVPDGNTDVVIKSGSVVLNSNASCRSLKVDADVILAVNPGYTLTITE